MITSLEAKKQHSQALIQLYLKNTLPLGFVASCSGTEISDVMLHLSQGEHSSALYAEWHDREGWQQSLAALNVADRIVITESAIFTAHSLDLLSLVAERWKLLAPNSLHRSYLTRRDECAANLKTGHRMVYAGGPGLRVTEFEAGHPVLEHELERAEAILAWLETNVSFQPRPFESIETDEEAAQLREMVGLGSFDAIALARSLNVPVYADDLGLRGLLTTTIARSFSTITMLVGLAEEATITAAERDTNLLKLAQRRYHRIPLTVSLVLLAASEHSRSNSSRLLEHLAPPTHDINSAAKLCAAVTRELAVASIQTTSISSIVEMFLVSMGTHWGRSASAYRVLRACSSELQLLPTALRHVANVCAAFGLRNGQI